MGSSQSSPPIDKSAKECAEGVDSTAATGDESAKTQSSPLQPSSTHTHRPRSTSTIGGSTAGLSGMPLVHHVCRKKKRRYDNCVVKHYQNFISGTTTTSTAAMLVDGDGGREPSLTLKQEDACGDRFEAYRECILKGIKKEVWDKQGLPPPGEGSPLAEVADEGLNY